MRSIKRQKTIDFLPLEEKEAKLSMKIYEVPSSLDMNEYKMLTNYNPLLLSACRLCNDMGHVKRERLIW